MEITHPEWGPLFFILKINREWRRREGEEERTRGGGGGDGRGEDSKRREKTKRRSSGFKHKTRKVH